jgi:hypothetical protein
VISEIEPLASTVGRVLNGYREWLRSLRGLVLCVRENRLRDVSLEAPDLLDWIGPLMGRAEDLGPPLSLSGIKNAIRKLEERHGMSSREFASRSSQEGQELPDAWQWRELLSVKSDLEKSKDQ